MKDLLIKTIAKENNFTVIKKLDENTKQYLKEHIQNSILDRYNYQPLEHIQEMIDEAIYFFEDDLQAINYIQSINYNINDTFYDIQKFSSINFVACNINMEVLPPFLTKLLLIYKV